MERSPLVKAILAIILVIILADCAYSRIPFLIQEQDMEDTNVQDVAEEYLRNIEQHPLVDMFKFCLAFFICYYCFRIFEDAYIIMHALYVHITEKILKKSRSLCKHH